MLGPNSVRTVERMLCLGISCLLVLFLMGT
uniref:Uncharacterized protein n=1 Tax=Arundo donax TaxID=35708 RepID=A0A0A8ZQU7_ARUDO